MRTVRAFLKTDAARAASNLSGNSAIGDFIADSDGRVAIEFHGAYTIDEIAAKLADLRHMQTACDAWRSVPCGCCGVRSIDLDK